MRWVIDGRPFAKERWELAVGTHVFRAVSERGDSSEARVEVLP